MLGLCPASITHKIQYGTLETESWYGVGMISVETILRYLEERKHPK